MDHIVYAVNLFKLIHCPCPVHLSITDEADLHELIAVLQVCHKFLSAPSLANDTLVIECVAEDLSTFQLQYASLQSDVLNNSFPNIPSLGTFMCAC
jgi:hypothetical protein